MKNILLILLGVLLIILIFSNRETFTNEVQCNWFDYNIDPHKCPDNTKCANIGICRSIEECEIFRYVIII
jgi:hypothetical protein